MKRINMVKMLIITFAWSIVSCFFIMDVNANSVIPIANDYEECTNTCSQENDLLKCAENYCSRYTSSSDDKRTCITTCGYNEPSFSTCEEESTKEGEDTSCYESTTASKSTCTPATVDTYYKTICTETSTITFSNTLPLTLSKGGSFKYESILTGNKSCRIVFELDRWMFDYASSYTDDERDALLDILLEFQNVNELSNWGLDREGLYKYSSNDAVVILSINEGNTSDTPTKKTLIPINTTNLQEDEIKVTPSEEIEVYLYENGTEDVETITEIINTFSTSETRYGLEGVCIDNEANEVYSPTDGACNDTDEGIFYEYFTDPTLEDGEYATFVEIEKTSSNLLVNNTCSYKIGNESNPPTGIDNNLIVVVSLVIVSGILFFSYRKLKYRRT